MRLDLVVKLKYESSTIIFFVGIRYSVYPLFVMIKLRPSFVMTQITDHVWKWML